MNRDEIRARLIALSEPALGRFNASLLPGVPHVLGVRMVRLRALAREIGPTGGACLLEGDAHYFEETLLAAVLIGITRHDEDDFFDAVARFVPRIDNWSVCDTFCAGLKQTRRHKARMWAFIAPYFGSRQPYDVRFALVMLIVYYIDAAHIDRTLQRIGSARHDDYYVRMAAAWATAACMTRFPDETLAFIGRGALDDWTHQKAIAKVCESRAIPPEVKAAARALKKAVRR